MEDSKIIELYLARDERSIAETAGKYERFCLTIAYNILCNNEDSEECVNDTWLKAWNSIPPTIPQSLRAFLGRITRNLAYDKYRYYGSERRRGGELPLSFDELQECIPAREEEREEYELRVLGEVINAFLAKLSRRDRNIFLCRYYYTYSITDIAKSHALGAAYVRNILFRTRQKLKEHLEKEGYRI